MTGWAYRLYQRFLDGEVLELSQIDALKTFAQHTGADFSLLEPTNDQA